MKRYIERVKENEPGKDFSDRNVERYRKIKSMIRSRLSYAEEHKDDKLKEFQKSRPQMDREVAGSNRRPPISGNRFEALSGVPAKDIESKTTAREIENIHNENPDEETRRTLKQLIHLKRNS